MDIKKLFIPATLLKAWFTVHTNKKKSLKKFIWEILTPFIEIVLYLVGTGCGIHLTVCNMTVTSEQWHQHMPQTSPVEPEGESQADSP